ncbi:hypothetical protein ABZ570_02805 [Micromonospora sp. NPDC007271]|uniref:hypothetical protein n=1 Tax=Micromonospora sp. NPDC007271 TaxID=3154587 RepID=UPI0033D565D3
MSVWDNGVGGDVADGQEAVKRHGQVAVACRAETGEVAPGERSQHDSLGVQADQHGG